MATDNNEDGEKGVAKIEDINLESIDEPPIVFQRLDSNMLKNRSSAGFFNCDLITFDRFCEGMFDKVRVGGAGVDETIKTCKINTTNKSKIERIERLLFGPPALKYELKSCRDMISNIACAQFNEKDSNHQAMLKTIYIRLTNSNTYHRYGVHWESVGFQGNDPITDLRACGILSLVLILYATEPKTAYSHLIQDVYVLSQSETQHFPFCLVAINLTGLILDCVRQGHLNACFNRIKIKSGTTLHEYDFVSMCGKFLVALLLEFHLEWKVNQRTVHEFGFVLKDLEKKLKKTPKSILKKLDVCMSGEDASSIKRCDGLTRKNSKKKTKKDTFELEFSILE